MVQNDYFAEYYEEPPSFEKERNFFTYGLVEFLLHTAFLILPFIPILIIATTVSCIPLAFFATAVMVLYASALLCRIAGFALYLLGGKLSYSGYFIARMFIIFYLFATAFLYPHINPLNILYRLNKDMKVAGSPFDSLFGHYAVVTGIAIFILIFICHFQILRYSNRSKEA